jgi:hypothetical protein
LRHTTQTFSVISSCYDNNFSLNTGDISLDISAKEFLKSLSKCESRAAADDDLTQAEVTDCFHQIKADYNNKLHS